MVTINPISSIYTGQMQRSQHNEPPKVIRRKTIDERLHDFFQNAKLYERRPLENFRGDRKIEAYRGDNHVNKITEKIANTPKLELIRNMIQVNAKGLKEKHYVDNAIILVTGRGEGYVQFYLKEPGNPKAGMQVKIYQDEYELVNKFFRSFADVRKDKNIMEIISQLTKKRLI